MEDLEAFVAIVEHGSQTAAARHLKRSLQSIGRSLVALERSIGLELVRRSTRRSGPTEAGLTLYRRLKPALLEIGNAKLEVASARHDPSGVLRVAAPVRFAAAYVVPVISEFMQRYPKVEVELRASDKSANVHEDGLDLAIRVRELPDSALKARRLGELRVVAYAAPSYLARYGRPSQPADLANHQCVVRSTDPDSERWPFRVRGRRTMFRVRGRFRCDDTAACESAVLHGLGLGLAPYWQVRPLLDEGRVQLVLEEFAIAKMPIFAVSPPSKVPSVTTRAFTDLLAASLKRARL